MVTGVYILYTGLLSHWDEEQDTLCIKRESHGLIKNSQEVSPSNFDVQRKYTDIHQIQMWQKLPQIFGKLSY